MFTGSELAVKIWGDSLATNRLIMARLRTVPVPKYEWPAVSQFLGRKDDVARLEDWWERPTALPLNLFGRRRVGKSWLFRRLAHGKPAVILVAEQSTPAQQFTHLVDQLAPYLPFRPEINDVGSLFRLLYTQSVDERTLVVIDEFPYLLGTTPAEQAAALSSVQATMERFRDESKIKLVLCGSAMAQMEALQAERSPLHGRLQRYELAPLEFSDARTFMPELAPQDQLTRYAIAGGMPRYLVAIHRGALSQVLAREIIDRNSPLFNEPLALLQSELREPATYLGILAAMATKPADSSVLTAMTGLEARSLGPYLERLQMMGLVRKRRAVGAEPKSRSTQYECSDGFLRFWFRFVQPYQANLEAGGDPVTHVKEHVLPELAGHTAREFERLLQRWTRQNLPGAAQVGAWWGPALNPERRAKRRFTEEIDVVGLKDKHVVLVGEAKWTTKPLPYSVLSDLVQYKLPALAQADFKTRRGVTILLASRSGFSQQLREAAENDDRITLLDADVLLSQVR